MMVIAKQGVRAIQIRAVLFFMALLTWHVQGLAAQGPTEDSLWYYEIGGAEPVSVPANPAVTSITQGGSAELGLGYSCGNSIRSRPSPIPSKTSVTGWTT